MWFGKQLNDNHLPSASGVQQDDNFSCAKAACLLVGFLFVCLVALYWQFFLARELTSFLTIAITLSPLPASLVALSRKVGYLYGTHIFIAACRK